MAKLSEEQKAQRAAKRRHTVALQAEAQALRHEEKRRQWHEQGMYLTWEEAAAGAPCRGCGLPVIDHLGNWPPLMHLTEQERIEYDAAESAYQAAHPDCQSHRWSMNGSRQAHCGLCCPPIPFSPETLEEIRRILDRVPANRDHELDTWALTLTCDHRIERTQHHTNSYWSASTVHCPNCDVTRGIVTAERITDAEARSRVAEERRKAAIDRARRNVVKAEEQAEAARQKLTALQTQAP